MMAEETGTKVKEILEKVKQLSDKDYQDFMCQSFDSSRPSLVQRAIVKYVKKKGEKNSKRLSSAHKEEILVSGMDQQGTVVSHPSSGINKSAWQVPFIFRPDLVADHGSLYIDVEKVSLKKINPQDAHKTVAATVAIVNHTNDLIMWAFVCWDASTICQTFPQLTRLDKAKLTNGLSISEVQRFLTLCVGDRKLIGSDVNGDLNSLGMKYEKTEDLQDYFYEMIPHDNNPLKLQKCGYSLSDLGKMFFPSNTFQCGQHSAIADARMTRDLHMKKEELIAHFPNFQHDCPTKIFRGPKFKYIFDPSDKCLCPRK